MKDRFVIDSNGYAEVVNKHQRSPYFKANRNEFKITKRLIEARFPIENPVIPENRKFDLKILRVIYYGLLPKLFARLIFHFNLLAELESKFYNILRFYYGINNKCPIRLSIHHRISNNNYWENSLNVVSRRNSAKGLVSRS